LDGKNDTKAKMILVGFNLDHLKNILKKLRLSSRPRKVDVPIWLILNKGLIPLVSKMPRK